VECIKKLLDVEQRYNRKYKIQIKDTYFFSRLAEIMAWGLKERVPERILFNYVIGVLKMSEKMNQTDLDLFASKLRGEHLVF
jgi:hypothetical protein